MYPVVSDEIVRQRQADLRRVAAESRQAASARGKSSRFAFRKALAAFGGSSAGDPCHGQA
jgi:hypothetical protein